MSVNLLAGVEPTLPQECNVTVKNGVVTSSLQKDKRYDVATWLVSRYTLTKEQTMHAGLSVRWHEAAATAGNIYLSIAYIDAYGAKQTTSYMIDGITTEWRRFEKTYAVPSGATVIDFHVSAQDVNATFDATAPCLSCDSPATIAAASHTPYATHGYVDACKAVASTIVPKAAVESSSTASQAYAAGDYVVVNGLLRKVKRAIAKGNAISDSNSTATTVTGELTTIGNSVSKSVYFLLYDDVEHGGRVVFYARGGIAILTVSAVSGVTAGTPLKLSDDTIPAEFRPDLGFYSPLVHRKSNNVGQIWVPAKVDNDPYVYIYASINSYGLEGSLYGTVSWIYTEPDDSEEK